MLLNPRIPNLFDDPFFRRSDEYFRRPEELLRRFFEASTGQAPAGVFPALDVYDDGERFLVRAELPGVAKESLEITARDGELTLSGERKPFEVESASHHRREAWSGRFSRTLTLPQPFDADKVTAKVEHGVLEVVLPRHQSVQPRKIAIS